MGIYPHLSEMTGTAIDLLDDSPDGFFLMVEGGLIDVASHGKNLARTVGEQVEFSNAVQVAMNWAAGRSDVLILVTADHETGGLSVTTNNGAGVLPGVTWSTTSHTAANVPVYAWGHYADRVWGVMNNIEIPAVINGTRAAAPAATATPLPAATETPLPVATETPLPVATETPLPVATETPLPVATATPLPVATETPLPVATRLRCRPPLPPPSRRIRRRPHRFPRPRTRRSPPLRLRQAPRLSEA